jgi:hypothetical protein
MLAEHIAGKSQAQEEKNTKTQRHKVFFSLLAA